MEKTVNKNKVYSGKILNVFCDDALAENGNPCIREYVHHPGGVCLLAVVDGKVAFVRQYRYAISRPFLELPAGKLEEGEDPYTAGLRELREETGLIADSLIPMGEMIPTVGYSDEVIYLYLAKGLTRGETDPDEDESLVTEWIDLDLAIGMASDGRIEDAKSALLLLRAAKYLQEKNL